MSNLRHSIRQQTAQLHSLESVVLRGPRPLPPGMINSPPSSPTESSFHSHRNSDMALPPPPPSSMNNMSKRNSREHLHGLAGPDSSLPLPRRDLSRQRSVSGGGLDDGMDGIKEGIPCIFNSASVHLHTPKRQSSPTRSLSRTSSPHHEYPMQLITPSTAPQEYLSRLWVRVLFGYDLRFAECSDIFFI